MANQTEPDQSARADEPTTSRRQPRGALWVGLGAIVGAVMALTFTTQGISLPGDAPTGERRAFSAPIGSCLDWTTPDGSDARNVDCASDHLFEVVGTVDLTTSFGPAAAFPTDQAWHGVVQQRCTPLAIEYLAGMFDPFGRLAVGALKPSQPGWRHGDRALHCGLQVNGRSGALYHAMTSAKSMDQANVYVPGTCLGIDGVDVGDPVDCAQPHAVEVVGNVDLAALLPAPEYPLEPKQDEVLAGACTKLADEYAGKPGLVAEKKLTVYWDTLKLESWSAGTRRVGCKLGALLPDKSGFAPITGGVRGEVQIDSIPAPPAVINLTPGAPMAPPPVPTTPPPPSPAPPGPETATGP
jgi:Septum formation